MPWPTAPTARVSPPAALPKRCRSGTRGPARNCSPWTGPPSGCRPSHTAPTGRRSAPEALQVWDARTGQELLSLTGHTPSVHAVAYSPEGSRIASGGHDATLKVWDARAEQPSLEGHTLFVSAVAFSPDGSRIASCSWDS